MTYQKIILIKFTVRLDLLTELETFNFTNFDCCIYSIKVTKVRRVYSYWNGLIYKGSFKDVVKIEQEGMRQATLPKRKVNSMAMSVERKTRYTRHTLESSNERRTLG